MGSFEDALRRQEVKHQASESARKTAQQDQESQHRRLIETAIPRITQLLQDFSSGLAGRGVKPTRVELRKRQGLLHPAQHSPAGYVTGSTGSSMGRSHRIDTLQLVTPEGKLWTYSTHSKSSGFVDLRTESIQIGAHTIVTCKPDGRILAVTKYFDEYSEEPLEDWLAGMAMGLIQRASR